MNRLVRVVNDTNMGLGYDGLNKLVKLGNLGKGEFVCFINKKKNKVKLATCQDMVAYHRLPAGQQIDPRVIQHLPEFFDGGQIQYDKAVEKVLRGTFPKWFEQ